MSKKRKTSEEEKIAYPPKKPPLWLKQMIPEDQFMTLESQWEEYLNKLPERPAPKPVDPLKRAKAAIHAAVTKGEGLSTCKKLRRIIKSEELELKNMDGEEDTGEE